MKNKKAFTLAETLIVLVILGIVASITIPPLVRRQIEASNRVKIKKAMGVYDTMMAKIAVENDLKSNAALQEWNTPDENGNYPVMNYLKPAKYLNDTKYQVQFSDGVACDFKYIQTPICAIKAKDLNEATAQSSTNRAFYFYAQFDNNGILRVSEPQFTYTLTTGADKIAVNASIARLYDFIDGKTSTSQEEVYSWKTEWEKFSEYSKNLCANPNSMEYCTNCKGCTIKEWIQVGDDGGYYSTYTYDANSHLIHHIDEDHMEVYIYNSQGQRTGSVTMNSSNECNTNGDSSAIQFCEDNGYSECYETSCFRADENP